jgi:hypothetical protein
MRSESPFRTKSLRLLGLGILVAVIDCLLLVSALRERHFAGIVLALLASLAAVGLVWLLWRETRAGLVQRATSESRESQKTTPGAEVSSPSLTSAEGRSQVWQILRLSPRSPKASSPFALHKLKALQALPFLPGNNLERMPISRVLGRKKPCPQSNPVFPH